MTLTKKQLQKIKENSDKIYKELHLAMNTPDKPKTVKRSVKPISYLTKEQKNDFYKLQKKNTEDLKQWPDKNYSLKEPKDILGIAVNIIAMIRPLWK